MKQRATRAVRFVIASALSLWTFTSVCLPPLAQSQSPGPPPPPTPTVTPVQQVIPTPPPPPPPTPEPVRTPIVIPTQTPPPYRPPIVVPTDVTSANPDLSTPNLSIGQPLAGLMQSKSFPNSEDLGGSPDFILVNGDESCYKRETPYLVNFLGGTILISVKRPSVMGMLNTPLGEVAFAANSDAFVNYENGVLRVRNVDGMGQTVKVRLDKGPFAGENSRTYSINAGYELILADHKLTTPDLRPNDGILRRRPQTIDQGYGAVSQFQVESALKASALIPKMTALESDAKVKRVLGDMSRMAAVLNHVNGVEGYSQ